METKKVFDLWGFAAYCEDEKLSTAVFATDNQGQGYELPSMGIRLSFSEIWVFPRHNLVFLGAGEQRGITFREVQRVEVIGESVIGKVVRLYCGYSRVPRMQMRYTLVLS